jgi:hypothetical protein
MAANRLPKLPELLGRKISKTGQTRGADDDVIYQNRVNRSSTVLIPYECWGKCAKPQDGTNSYERSFIVLLSPPVYFNNPRITAELASKGLVLGTNALVFYETREQWTANDPVALGWTAATKRTTPLGGYYVARIPATTAKDKAKAKKIISGFHKTKPKGAGIRVYEYANRATSAKCRLQLEALFWLCDNSEKVAVSNGMSTKDVATRKTGILVQCKESGLLDTARLTKARILNARGKTICPLCLEELSGQGFFNRMEQAEGRVVPDLTITQINLFHIAELRYGVLNHRPYNVGWGHHHCNVVVKDSGIRETLEWMRDVLRRNVEDGHFPAENNAS